MSAVERLPASTAAELPRRRLLAWLVLVVRREDGLGPHYHRLSDVGDDGRRESQEARVFDVAGGQDRSDCFGWLNGEDGQENDVLLKGR